MTTGTAFAKVQNPAAVLFQGQVRAERDFNRPGVKASEAIIANWWRQGMMGGVKVHYDGIVAFWRPPAARQMRASKQSGKSLAIYGGPGVICETPEEQHEATIISRGHRAGGAIY